MQDFSSQLSWRYRRRLKEQGPCRNITAAARFAFMEPIGYLIVEANGGLRQQSSLVCNAVAVAGLLNEILFIPQFQFHSVWRDPSGFGDIYVEDHFINTHKGYMAVVWELPKALMERYDNFSNIPNFRVKAWASVSYYLGEVYPILREQGKALNHCLFLV